MLDAVLPDATDEEWWEVEAQLCALERLKLGTTCMYSMMGGNGTRTDDVVFAQTAARELERIGLRTRIGVGPARPPWPRTYTYWRGGVRTERQVPFDEVIANCDRLLAENRQRAGGIVDYGVALSRIGNRNEHDPVWDPEKERWIRRQAEAVARPDEAARRRLLDAHVRQFDRVRARREAGAPRAARDTFALHGHLRARDRHHARDRGPRRAPPARRAHLHLSRALPGAGADRGGRQRRPGRGHAGHAQLRHLSRHEGRDRPAAHPLQGPGADTARQGAGDGDRGRLQGARPRARAGIGGSREAGGSHHRGFFAAAPVADGHAGLPARVPGDRARRQRRRGGGAARHAAAAGC